MFDSIAVVTALCAFSARAFADATWALDAIYGSDFIFSIVSGYI